MSNGNDDMVKIWDTFRVLLDYEDELDTLILALDQRSVIYYGARGSIVFEKFRVIGQQDTGSGRGLFQTRLSCSKNEPLADVLRNTMMFHDLPWLTPILLRRLGQHKFSRCCGNDTSLLDAVFRLDGSQITDSNIWELEAASEVVGRAWCSLLEDCGLDAKLYVQQMVNLNSGQDVFLRTIDCGRRGNCTRRLVRGTSFPIFTVGMGCAPIGESLHGTRTSRIRSSVPRSELIIHHMVRVAFS